MTSRERRAPGREGQDRPGRRVGDRPDHRPRPDPATRPTHHRPGRGPARPVGLPRRPAGRTHRAGQPCPRRADRPGTRLPAPDPQPGHPGPGPPGPRTDRHRPQHPSRPDPPPTPPGPGHRRRSGRPQTPDRRPGHLRRQLPDHHPRHRTRWSPARFLAEVVDARRYPTTNAFAAANGSAPLPASSGRTIRHRYNPGGNRQLNRALYTIAITQIRGDTEGRAYYRRKRAEGKTTREALRCLKRRISDRVYRTMRADAATRPSAATTATSPPASPPRPPVQQPPSTSRCAPKLAVGADDANKARLMA